jgi:hypothetical protein
MPALRSCFFLVALATSVNAAVHELIVGTFVSKALYILAFDDEENSLELIANISTPVPSSWISLSVSVAEARRGRPC